MMSCNLFLNIFLIFHVSQSRLIVLIELWSSIIVFFCIPSCSRHVAKWLLTTLTTTDTEPLHTMYLHVGNGGNFELFIIRHFQFWF